MLFLIAYDIADPKRLREVARCLEQHAERVQKSVFLFEGEPAQLRGIQRDLLKLIDPHEDRVQSWPIHTSRHLHRWDAGCAMPGQAQFVVISPRQMLIFEDGLA